MSEFVPIGSYVRVATAGNGRLLRRIGQVAQVREIAVNSFDEAMYCLSFPDAYEVGVPVDDVTPVIYDPLLLQRLANEVIVAVDQASTQYPAYNSLHEAYGVIKEEFDEFWAEVKRKQHQRDTEAVRKELIDMAATCVRTILDCGPDFKR